MFASSFPALALLPQPYNRGRTQETEDVQDSTGEERSHRGAFGWPSAKTQRTDSAEAYFCYLSNGGQKTLDMFHLPFA